MTVPTLGVGEATASLAVGAGSELGEDAVQAMASAPAIANTENALRDIAI